MEDILKVESITDNNILKGVETKHLLISCFDNANSKALPTIKCI